MDREYWGVDSSFRGNIWSAELFKEAISEDVIICASIITFGIVESQLLGGPILAPAATSRGMHLVSSWYRVSFAISFLLSIMSR